MFYRRGEPKEQGFEMRLLDAVAQGPRMVVVRSPAGQEFEMPGPGIFSEAVRRCTTRYVLDRRASGQCGELMVSAHGLPTANDPILRLPTTNFWVEGFADDTNGKLSASATGDRVGLFIEMGPSGRSGRITEFGEEGDGTPVLLAGRIVFDLDSRIPADRSAGRYRMRHNDLPAVNSLLAHAGLVFDVDWLRQLQSSGINIPDLINQQADVAWCALPILVAFNALLNSRTSLNSKPSELARLNTARLRRGKPALLEHVEISLNLTPSRNPDYVTTNHVERRAPRFHFVRGHSVRRAGKIFWRTSHFRGDHGAMPITTVRVTANSRGSRRGTPDAEI